MNDNKQNELKDVAFRINAVYDNEKTINFLGFSKNKETGKKTDLRATIFKTKQSGEITKAYEEYSNLSTTKGIVKGDLLLTTGGNFRKYNDQWEYTIQILSGVIKSKFNVDGTPKEENQSNQQQPVQQPAPQVENLNLDKPVEELIDEEEKANVQDIPWDLEL